MEWGAIFRGYRVDTVQHYHHNAHDNTGDQHHIEGFAGPGFGAEDDFMQIVAPICRSGFMIIGHYGGSLTGCAAL